MKVDLRLVVHALSEALDLVGINDVHHGKRVGIMAMEMLRQLGAAREVQERAFDAGLVHDIGVSSTDLHHHLVEDFDWEGSVEHAVLGARLLQSFPPLAGLAPIVGHHHTHWSQLRGNYGPDERLANLIFLADRVDVLAAVAMAQDALARRVPSIRAQIAAAAGEMFDPELVDAFLATSQRDAFWLMLEPDAVRDIMDKEARDAHPVETDLETLRGLAELFSHVVDAKSRFTVEHSEDVARLAHYLAELAGLDSETAGKIEIAGLLHDIGKLRIPDALLEKPGELEPHERRQMAAHAFETFRILSRIPGFEEIARWASFHHESPDGEGYPFRLRDPDLPLEAHLVRAADIFQALSQDRPYRPALPAVAVLGHMRQLCESGKLHRGIYDLLAEHLAELYQLAQPRGKSLT